MPDPQDVYTAALSRAADMAAFARATSELGEFNEEQTKWLTVGMSCGVTAAVEELHARGMLTTDPSP